MLKCPNEKCGSELPNTYRYCIYCSAKLPSTPQNRKQREKADFTPLQIGVAAAAFLTAILFIIGLVVIQ